MSKGVFTAVLSIASFALMAIPGVGTALGIGMQIGLGLGVTVAQAVGLGLALASSVLLGPKAPKGMGYTPTNNLYGTLDPNAPRKIAFGNTALATDIRFHAYTGSDQTIYEQIICVASHTVSSIDEIWFDNEQAWTSGGGVLGRYATSPTGPFLWVATRNPGTNANGIAINSVWTSSCTLTGCSYVHLKYRLVDGGGTRNDSPFAGGISNRITIRGKGALLYDPRLDSTVAGGSGTQRANDQTTWTYNSVTGVNPALQLLYYLLGWKINGKLAVGMGLPASRIDLPSFITAANICEESVSLSGGGTEKRYRSAGVVSEGDDRGAVIENLCASMNATLSDAGGKIALRVTKNDLGSPVMAFTLDDILGEESWKQTPSLDSSFNIVRGRWVNPSDNALYQYQDYPEVSLTSVDGIARLQTLDFPFVQSASQAQRLAKQFLQRNQYQGRYSAVVGPRAWQATIGDVVTLTHGGLGWSNKLFRMVEQSISRTGETRVTLLEENSAIYSWSAEETAPVTPPSPTVYDPTLTPINQLMVDSSNNRVRYSRMEAGTRGWAFTDNPNSLTATLAAPTIIGVGNLSLTTTFTANTQLVYFGTMSNVGQYLIPVTPGERIYVGGIIATGSIPSVTESTLQIGFLNSSGTEIARPDVGTLTGGSSGTEIGAFFTVPANSVSAFLRVKVANKTGGAGVADVYLKNPIVCGAGANQLARPLFSPGPSNETAADLTTTVVGPARSDVLYDNAGTTFQGANDLAYKAQSANGTVTSQVSAIWRVVSGTFNGLTSASGNQTLSLTSGVGVITPTAQTTDTATIEVVFTVADRVLPAYRTELTKVRAPATPTGTGGGGSGTTDVPSQTSGFTAINTSSFTTITNNLTFTLPTGKTTLRCVIDLSCKYIKTANQNGPWNVEFKVQRGGVDQGTNQNSNPDPFTNLSGDSPVTEPGTMQYTLDMSGLSSGTQYTVVIQARVSSGTLPTNGVNMTFNGSVALSAP